MKELKTQMWRKQQSVHVDRVVYENSITYLVTSAAAECRSRSRSRKAAAAARRGLVPTGKSNIISF